MSVPLAPPTIDPFGGGGPSLTPTTPAAVAVPAPAAADEPEELEADDYLEDASYSDLPTPSESDVAAAHAPLPPVADKPLEEAAEESTAAEGRDETEADAPDDDAESDAAAQTGVQPEPIGQPKPPAASAGSVNTPSPSPSQEPSPTVKRSLPPRPDTVPPEAARAEEPVAPESAPAAVDFSALAQAPGALHMPTASSLPGSSAESAPTHFALPMPVQTPLTKEQQTEALVSNARALTELCELQLQGKPDMHRAARLYYEAARLYESPLGELQRAAKHYEAAAKLAPDHLPSWRGLRRVQLRLRRYQQSLKAFDAESRGSGDPAARAMLAYGKACLLEGQLGQKPDAREAFEQAADLQPHDLSLLRAAAHAREQALSWAPLVETMEREANTLSAYPSLCAAHLAQMARLVAVRLKDVPRAIELYKQAWHADPAVPGAAAALEELLYQQERFGELVEVLERRAQQAKDLPTRALRLLRVGRLQVERLGDTGAGIVALEHAASIAPTDATILQELARVYELAGRYEELTSAEERLVALEAAPTADQLFRLGQLYDEKLAQPEYAIERYMRALSVKPDHGPSLLNLERLRVQRGEWSELAQMLAQQANSCLDSNVRAALLCRIANLCETRLGALSHAIDHHKKALESSPGYAASYKALVRLLSAHGKWHELVEIYERRLEEEISEAERIATLFKLGRIEEDALGLPAAAVSTYRRILDVKPDHLEALEALQRAAERGGRFEELVEALELEAQRVSGTPRQLELLHRAALVLDDELSQTARATSQLEALLEQEPSYRPAIKTLQELYHREGQFEALARTLERELHATTEPDDKASLHHQIGEVYEVRIGLEKEAIKHHRMAVRLSGHSASWRALLRLLTRAGDYKEVVQLLEQAAQAATEPDRRAQLFYQAGELYENRLEAPDKALQSFHSALEARGDFRPARVACVRLLEQKRDYRALADQLQTELDSAADEATFVDGQYRLAELWRDHLKQLPTAAGAFEAVLERQPGNPAALMSLERLYVQLEDSKKLATVYRREVTQLPSVETQVTAYRSWLRLLEAAKEPDAQAIRQAYQAILTLLPTDPHALLALERIALETDDRDLLQQVDAKLGVSRLDSKTVASHQTRLAEAMEARGDHSALEVFRAALSQDGENMAAARGISRIAQQLGAPELLVEAADNEALLLGSESEGARMLVLAAAKLSEAGDLPGASARLTSALEMDPNNAEAAQALTAVHADSQGERAGFLVDAISRAAGSATSSKARGEMWVKVARLHAERTRDNGAAIAAALRAVRERPEDTEPRMLLSEYYLRGSLWKECVAQLQELLKRKPGPELELKALLQLAAVQNDRLGKPAPAESHAKAALKLSPDNREALSVLLRIQLARELPDKAAETAKRLAEVSVSSEERAEALFQSARLEVHRQSHERAKDAFAGAVAILGAGGEAAKEFKVWLQSRGPAADWNAFCQALLQYLQGPELTDQERITAYAELGRTMDVRLGDTRGGIEYLRAALQLSPTDDSLRTEIAQRLAKVGDHEAAVEFYLELVDRQPLYAPHWRALSQAYERLVRLDQQRLALAPLVARGEATVAEVQTYDRHKSRVSSAVRASLGATELVDLEVGAPVRGAGAELIKAMTPALTKLHPAPLADVGLTKADRLTPRSNHAVRHVADRVAAVFGLTEYELYLHQKTGGVRVGLGEPNALLIAAEVESLSESEQAFMIARAIANLVRGLGPVDALGDSDVIASLVALARQQSKGYAPHFSSGADLDSLAKRITKAMPWFSGGKLEAAARSMAIEEIDPAAWLRHVHITAGRAALLVCDDVAPALRHMERTGVEPAVIKAIVGFSFSEQATQLRRKLFAT